MSSASILTFVLNWVTFIYDLLTLPIYAILQQPWRKLRDDKEPKSQAINYQNGITYRSLVPISSMHITLERNHIDTMEKVFTFGVLRNGHKRCLGSREIIDEEDEIQPNQRIFKKFVLGEYMWKSYIQVEKLVVEFSRGLLELGLKEKDTLAIYAETRAEWLIAANAAFKQNLTIVTLYATLGEDAVIHGLNETQATHVVTSHELLPKFWYILEKVPTVTHIIFMEDPLKKTDTRGYRSDVQINSFCSVLDIGSKSSLTKTTPPTPNDIAIIMYTSGSTGVPKGVELSHNNILSGMMSFCDSLGPIYADDCYIAFLPLAHVLEFMIEAFALLSGVPIGYSSPLTITEQSGKVKRGCKGDAALLRPTVMASVPLILDRISKAIQDKIGKSGQLSKVVFNHFYDYKLRWYERGYDTPILNLVLFSSMKNILGGHVRLIITGGAPLSPDTQEFVRTCLCCPLLQGYGLTETAACASCCLSADRSLGRVGGNLGCCDIRLVDWEEGNYRVTDHPHPRGEILIGGDNVSVGYYKLPDVTKAEFFSQDGRRWFRTGDIAEMQSDGCLKIIDRKKDLVKLQFGEYVSLGKVESELKTCPLVDNICIYGDSSKLFCVALVVPSVPNLQKLAKDLGRPDTTLKGMCEDSELTNAALMELQKHGRKSRLQKFELPGGAKLVNEIWSPEMGLVTAAFKLKRKNVQEKYQTEIDQMYSQSPSS